MCTRGVWQLEKLTLRYCSRGGSSSGVRQFVRSGLVDFAKASPQIEVHVVEAAGKHPTATGEYTCGKSKTFPLRKLHDRDVADALQSLRSSSGRKLTKFKKVVYSAAPSVQGIWNNETIFATEEMDVEHIY